jgi:hypothetical protein
MQILESDFCIICNLHVSLLLIACLSLVAKTAGRKRGRIFSALLMVWGRNFALIARLVVNIGAAAREG